MRPHLTQSCFTHCVIRFHTSSFSFERASGKPKPFGFSRSEKLRHRGGFGLPGAPAQKKMDKGQYPLSAKRKCHANIPAANILTLLPAAGARKGGFLKKAPFQSRKNFSATVAEPWVCAPKVAHQPASRTAGAPAARRRRDVGRAHSKLRASLLAAPQGVPQKGKRRADVPHRICAGFALYGQIAVIADFP